MFKEFGAQEVMWDWEGKLVDESVIERLLGADAGFFQKKPLGKKLFLTFRIPNPRIESGYRLGRAFMVILSAQHFSQTAGLPSTPLFEVILPMTESASEIMQIQKSFVRLSKAAGYSFGTNGLTSKPIDVIPLFEKIETILRSRSILERYIKFYKRSFGTDPEYLRPFCARSDPALNSGIVPTTLSVKWALSEFSKFTTETGIDTYPIIAPGGLPFRGGLTPETSQEFLFEFSGIKTLVIQSSFRYDNDIDKVKKAIKSLSRTIPRSQTKILPQTILKEIHAIIPLFEKPYKKTVEEIAPLIEQISKYIPQRRERIQHTGLFGYSREVSKVKLPRAIGFTASCYSLGIPPELFGMGQGLRLAKRQGKLNTIETLYTNLKPSLIRAGRYIRKESLRELGLNDLEDEIKLIEQYVGQELGPVTDAEIEHQQLVAKIIVSLNQGKSPMKEIEQTALLRKSMG